MVNDQISYAIFAYSSVWFIILLVYSLLRHNSFLTVVSLFVLLLLFIELCHLNDDGYHKNSTSSLAVVDPDSGCVRQIFHTSVFLKTVVQSPLWVFDNRCMRKEWNSLVSRIPESCYLYEVFDVPQHGLVGYLFKSGTRVSVVSMTAGVVIYSCKWRLPLMRKYIGTLQCPPLFCTLLQYCCCKDVGVSLNN